MQENLSKYLLHLADNSLILGQQNSAWTGHGPILEQDIALSNITLDLIGQARFLYQYAAEILNAEEGENRHTEDTLAYLRDVRDFKNFLIMEQPNGDWGNTIMRQFLYSSFQYFQYKELVKSSNNQLAAIAEKSLKEITYHLRWSSEWVIRLGDGTDESHHRMATALRNLWRFTGEFFLPAEYELILYKNGICCNPHTLKSAWENTVINILQEATLYTAANRQYMEETLKKAEGKNGMHTERLGYILSEMQFLQRAYPNSEW